MGTPCTLCNERLGYPATEGLCTRCARDHRLFKLRELADQAEKQWADYADLIYRVEVWEGLRPPPSNSNHVTDRPSPHGAQGDPATGVSYRRRQSPSEFSPLMKQGPGRSTLTEDDLT